MTATDSGGETAQASVVITSAQLTLNGPKVGTYGRRTTFRGRMIPALRGAPITLYSGDAPVRKTKLGKKGRFVVRVRQSAPTTYSARFETVPSNPVAVAVRPGLDVAVPRSGMLGRPLVVRAVLRPRSSGTLHVRVWRSGHELAAKDFGGRAVVHLSTKRIASYVVRITATPTGDFVGRQKTVRTNVFLPYLADGAHGPSVRTLERRLAQLHYLLRGVDSFYSYDTADAVLAFQKVNGLARTGRVTPLVWRRLQSAHTPRPRYRYGHHIEVDKSKQVLFEVNRRRRRPRRARVDRRNGQHAGRPLAHLQQGPGDAPDRNVRLELLPARLRDPRLPIRAHLSRLPRLRAHADLGGPDSLRLELLRRADLHLLLASPRCWAGSWPRLLSSSSSCRTGRATRSPGATPAGGSARC